MNNLIELGGDGLLALFHGKNGESLIPKPFERDIFLLDTHVAGTTYIEGIDELEPYLKSGDRLNLFREPDNPYDEFAILIKTMDGVKIGYIPQKDIIIFARLMESFFLEKLRKKKRREIGCELRFKFSCMSDGRMNGLIQKIKQDPEIRELKENYER